jgi:two-component sensor histidine kinase
LLEPFLLGNPIIPAVFGPFIFEIHQDRCANLARSIFFITQKPGKDCVLVVEDDGSGIPSSLLASEGDSLGLKLVRVLTDQLDGDLRFGPMKEDPMRPGTKVEIRMPRAY